LSGRLYEALALVAGLVLIDYGFNFVATGVQGARQFTSQFLGANLLIGGSAMVFFSLYYLLKPEAQVAKMTQPAQPSPDVGVGLVVEEATPPKPGFYRNIEYIGYFFAFLGLISAADLVLQVFVRSTYDELRWWVEILLVTFGVLSYTILGSIGHLGAQEEAKLMIPPTQPHSTSQPIVAPATASSRQLATPSLSGDLTLNLADFSKSDTGDYERRVSGNTYDMFRVEEDLVSVWREDRREMGSVYLFGPYKVSRTLMEAQARNGQELTIGNLTLSVDTMRKLLELEHQPLQPATSTPS